MAGPTFRASSSGSGSGTTITVTKPTGVVDGDFLLVVIAHANNGGTVTPPAGWTSLVASPGFNNNWHFWKVASSEGASWAFTLSSDSYVWGCAAGQPALSGALAIDVSGFGAGTAGDTTTGAVTTTKADTLLFVTVYNANDFVAYTPPGTLTELADQGINPQPRSWLGYRTTNQAAAGSTGTFVFTVGDVADYGLIAIYESLNRTIAPGPATLVATGATPPIQNSLTASPIGLTATLSAPSLKDTLAPGAAALAASPSTPVLTRAQTSPPVALAAVGASPSFQAALSPATAALALAMGTPGVERQVSWQRPPAGAAESKSTPTAGNAFPAAQPTAGMAYTPARPPGGGS